MADVTGVQWADNIRDELVLLMTALLVSNAADDPRLAFQYDRHAVAKLQLPAVTVDLASTGLEWVGVGNGPNVRYMNTFSLRVHTGYEGDSMEGRKITRLMEGVQNKLWANLNLGTCMRIEDIDQLLNLQTFEESATVGGEILVVVSFDTNYVQE